MALSVSFLMGVRIILREKNEKRRNAELSLKSLQKFSKSLLFLLYQKRLLSSYENDPERTTEIKLMNNDTLLVKMKDLGTDRMNQLTQRFLTEINNLAGRTLDKFHLKLLFDVELEK